MPTPTVRQNRLAIHPFALAVCFSLCLISALSGCASSKLERAGSLSTYDNLSPANNHLTQSQQRIDRAEVLAAKTISIHPTRFSDDAASAALTDQQRALIANAIDRSICLGLSSRFQIVGADHDADLIVHATVTHVTVTNAYSAGASQVVSSVLTVAPRIPVGLGALSVEAEASDTKGKQNAAIVWARGATSLSTARVSSAGDAYELASYFGGDFSKLLVTGENPINGKLSLPSMPGKAKSAACDIYGRTGAVSWVAGMFGAPPEWFDKGAADQKRTDAQAANSNAKTE